MRQRAQESGLDAMSDSGETQCLVMKHQFSGQWLDEPFADLYGAL